MRGVLPLIPPFLCSVSTCNLCTLLASALSDRSRARSAQRNESDLKNQFFYWLRELPFSRLLGSRDGYSQTARPKRSSTINACGVRSGQNKRRWRGKKRSAQPAASYSTRIVVLRALFTRSVRDRERVRHAPCTPPAVRPECAVSRGVLSCCLGCRPNTCVLHAGIPTYSTAHPLQVTTHSPCPLPLPGGGSAR